MQGGDCYGVIQPHTLSNLRVTNKYSPWQNVLKETCNLLSLWYMQSNTVPSSLGKKNTEIQISNPCSINVPDVAEYRCCKQEPTRSVFP